MTCSKSSMNARVIVDQTVPFAALDPLWVFTSSGLAVVLAGERRPGAPDSDEARSRSL